MRLLITLALNALIWIGLGKWGVEKMFPELMASSFAGSIPFVMLFGGVLTAVMITSNLFIHTVGRD